jgi:hypothetical protein
LRVKIPRTEDGSGHVEVNEPLNVAQSVIWVLTT